MRHTMRHAEHTGRKSAVGLGARPLARDVWLAQGTPRDLHVWITTAAGTARMEFDNDEFPVTAPHDSILEALSRPLSDACKIMIKKLAPEAPLKTTIRAAPKTPQIPKPDGGDPMDTPITSKTDTIHVNTPTAPRPGGDIADTPSEESTKASKALSSHQERSPLPVRHLTPSQLSTFSSTWVSK